MLDPSLRSTVIKKTGSENVSKAQLSAASKVFAKMDNFDFDINVNVTEYMFSMVVNGNLVEKNIKGDRLNGEVKNLIDRAKRGSKVYFEGIRVKMPDGSVRKLSPVVLKLTS